MLFVIAATGNADTTSPEPIESQLGLVVCACSCSTWEAESKGLTPELHSEFQEGRSYRMRTLRLKGAGEGEGRRTGQDYLPSAKHNVSEPLTHTFVTVL